MYRILPPFWNLDEILLIMKYFCGCLDDFYSKFIVSLNYLFYPKKFILLASGRSAIYSILKLKSFSEGSKVIIPSFVCAAAISPIIKAKMTPVFVDIMDDLTMDPNDLERKMTKDVVMVIMPHVYGKVCDFIRIRKITKNRDVLLIDDASPCAGLKYNDVTMGLLGDYGIFSMNFKTITSVLGGGIIFNSDDEYAFFKAKMNNIKKSRGILKKALISSLSRILYRSNLYYYLQKFRKVRNLEPINEDISIEKISDLTAAIGYKQIKKLKIIQEKREANSFVLKNILDSNSNVNVVTSNRKDFFTRFIIKINVSHKIARRELEKLKAYLFDKKIQTFDVYTPGHLLLGKSERLPKTEDMWKRCLVIPNNPLYDKKDMEYIADCINSFFVRK